MRKFDKNTDPHYWDIPHPKHNCGSLAFNIKSWYSPEWKYHEVLGCDDIDDWAQDLWNEGWESWYIADKIAEIYTEGILEDFGNTVRILNVKGSGALYELQPNEELIAFRVASGWNNGDVFEADVDFHFKVYRDGKWIEKNGGGPVHECEEESEEDWEYDSYLYESQTIYFAHKIA